MIGLRHRPYASSGGYTPELGAMIGIGDGILVGGSSPWASGFQSLSRSPRPDCGRGDLHQHSCPPRRYISAPGDSGGPGCGGFGGGLHCASRAFQSRIVRLGALAGLPALNLPCRPMPQGCRSGLAGGLGPDREEETLLLLGVARKEASATAVSTQRGDSARDVSAATLPPSAASQAPQRLKLPRIMTGCLNGG